MGLFATRSPHRPNPVGLTLAQIEKIEGLCKTNHKTYCEITYAKTGSYLFSFYNTVCDLIVFSAYSEGKAEFWK